MTTENCLQNLRVLVAEDCAINQMVAESMLTEMGCTVTVVDNGLLAVESVNTDQFDVLLMDCQMPVMDGYEATRRIRESEKSLAPSLHLPICALTANTLPEDRIRCQECGMDDFLGKPFDMDALSQMLLRHRPLAQ